jgi:lipopolysaccharide cholinephosphotransferase
MEDLETRNKKVQQKLLEIFKRLVAFLEEHGLSYCSCGGTTLGAVRHKGFIPWDDDIDIYMPRLDYDKLLSMRKQLKSNGYDILSMVDNGYIYPYAKFVDSNTTVWESKAYNLVYGLYIDVFPLDEFSCTEKELLKKQQHSIRLVRRYWKSRWHFDLQNVLTHFPNEAVLAFYYYRHLFPEHYLRKFQKYEQTYIGGEGDLCLCMTQWEGKVFRSEWFRFTEKVIFEDMEIVIPSYVDKYLSLLYGDFMTLPPESKRRIHERVYINLHEGLTIGEVRHRLKQGERFV